MAMLLSIRYTHQHVHGWHPHFASFCCQRSGQSLHYSSVARVPYPYWPRLRSRSSPFRHCDTPSFATSVRSTCRARIQFTDALDERVAVFTAEHLTEIWPRPGLFPRGGCYSGLSLSGSPIAQKHSHLCTLRSTKYKVNCMKYCRHVSQHSDTDARRTAKYYAVGPTHYQRSSSSSGL